MSLSSFYTTLELLRYQKSNQNFGTPRGLSKVQDFQGIIQPPRNTNQFINGKQTSQVVGILFADVEMDSIIKPDDRIRMGRITYLVSGSGTQQRGVTGIKAHHIEYELEYDNGANS